MRKILLCLLFCAVMSTHLGEACVGKTLFVGVTSDPQEQMLAQMISIMVNERTGTTVKVVTYRDAASLYGAVKKGEVGVLVEQPESALQYLKQPVQGSPKASYDTAKRKFRQALQLVWLEPFGGSRYYAPVISLETINSLPALPKLLNKLAGVVTDDVNAKLLRAARGDKDQKKVVRDYLRSRKLI